VNNGCTKFNRWNPTSVEQGLDKNFCGAEALSAAIQTAWAIRCCGFNLFCKCRTKLARVSYLPASVTELRLARVDTVFTGGRATPAATATRNCALPAHNMWRLRRESNCNDVRHVMANTTAWPSTAGYFHFVSTSRIKTQSKQTGEKGIDGSLKLQNECQHHVTATTLRGVHFNYFANSM
jgi:hypothetical protein